MEESKSKDKKSYKEVNGTTRVGDFLRGVKGVAPDILDLAGAVTGVTGLTKLGDKIRGTTSMTPEDKELALKELEYDVIDAQEITKRWTSDMTSDSWASKNIRPYTLAFLTLSLAVLITLDSALEGFTVESEWITLLTSLLMLVYGAYFGGRSAEKIWKIKNNK